MKKIFESYPNMSRLVLAALLIFLALILSGIISNGIFLRKYFPFTGTILVLLATWVMYRTENKGLSQLGLALRKHNLLFLLWGLLSGIIAFLAGFYLKTFITGEQWNINTKINYTGILQQLYWILPTAAVQELIARGYCFQKIATMRNNTVAIIVCGLLFIAMHNIMHNNIVLVIASACNLFIGHLLFATALLRTGTLYAAIGLHWGNNLANSILFTEGHRDTALLYTTHPYTGFMGLPVFILMFLCVNMGFLMLTLLLSRIKKKNIHF